MGDVRIVTDSTSDIPLFLRQSLNIEVVPLKVQFGDESYVDGVTIQPEQFYEKLAASASLPTTSQPSPVDFVDVYHKLADDTPGMQVVSIHLSSTFSGTYQSALLAKSMMKGKADIHVIDSRSASYGCGAMAVAAARAAQAGKPLEQCVQAAHNIFEKMNIYFLVDTLDYLQKGGRIGKAASLIGSLLAIKPILTIDDEGQVASVEKARGSKKAMARIVERLQDRFGDMPVNLVVAHANAQPSAEQFAEQLKSSLHVEEIMFTSLGPVIGAHVGPGTLAVFACPA
ncbi:MAG: domain protein DegV family [Paenibacillaceae bacterium]|jgi:DegV family protein with EDD domain|nr:domain protein DegV family [Paenibacillaceae bacterium]